MVGYGQGLNRVKKLLFIRIPKNASSSIYSLYSELNLLSNDIVFKHGTLYNILNTLNYKPYAFCVVRNPYDRFISMFKYILNCIKTDDNGGRKFETCIKYNIF